jgi:hypothetical protein
MKKKNLQFNKKETLAKFGDLKVVASFKRIIEERRIWYFTCGKCGKDHRSSHKRINARRRICAKCRRAVVPENQARLFQITGVNIIAGRIKGGEKMNYIGIGKV